MDIQPIVIGTAGHIDHGKSTLVQALTGIDPDRLKEEKERGLTIDLGFARLPLSDGRTVGIVDVPGHERFVRNMVAGATGIDLVVLVVAADDGVMPQTREHLDIMGLVGVERGLIALTKVDVVEDELAELAAEDVREAVQGTFLEDAPLFPVSGVTGAGLDEFRTALEELAAATPPRSAEGVFRMPIQRVFTKQGFGTVVTGIPVGGRVSTGETLEVLPSGSKGKVRGLHAYGQAADTARAGHSTAINLSDLERAEVKRGDVVAAPGFFRATRMVAARLSVLPGAERPLENRLRVRLHTGTADPAGELILLDRETLPAGESGLIQIRLDDPVICAPGDRFVLRLLSPMVTLGGGVILEESRYRLKRFKNFVIEELAVHERSLQSPKELLVSTLLRRGLEWLTAAELAVELKQPREDVSGWLDELGAEGRLKQLGKKGCWIHVDGLRRGLDRLRAELDTWIETNPHRRLADVRDLRRATGLEDDLFAALLAELEVLGEVSLEGGGQVRPAAAGGDVSDELRELSRRVLESLDSKPFQPPNPEELVEVLKAPEKELKAAFELLEDEQSICRVGGAQYLTAAAIERARQAVVKNCEAHGHLEIPVLRDELGTSRKYLIPLLEYFDVQGVTLRQGGHRVLKKT